MTRPLPSGFYDLLVTERTLKALQAQAAGTSQTRALDAADSVRLAETLRTASWPACCRRCRTALLLQRNWPWSMGCWPTCDAGWRQTFLIPPRPWSWWPSRPAC